MSASFFRLTSLGSEGLEAAAVAVQVLMGVPREGSPVLSQGAWPSSPGTGAVLVVHVLLMVALGVLLLLTGLGVEELRETPLPPAASSLAARALVWCRTERMWISRVELWL